jgi:hypothetical protein
MRPGPLWRNALRLALLGLLSCSTGSSLSLAQIDLAGVWVLKDSSNAPPPGGTVPNNPCVIVDLPMVFTAIAGDSLWQAEQGPSGGTYYCKLGDSVTGQGSVPFTELTLNVLRRRDSLYLYDAASTELWFLGRLRSPDLMTGRRDPAYNGRTGTWEARRAS